MSITFTTIMPQRLQILLKKQQPGVIIHPLPNAWVETTGFRFLFQQACSSETKNGKNHYRVEVFQSDTRVGRLDYEFVKSKRTIIIDKSHEGNEQLGNDGLGIAQEFLAAYTGLQQALLILAFTHALSQGLSCAFIQQVVDIKLYENLNINWVILSNRQAGEDSLPSLRGYFNKQTSFPPIAIELIPSPEAASARRQTSGLGQGQLELGFE